MIRAVIFDFYGVIYSNFDWEVIDKRIYSKEDKAAEFRTLIKSANLGEITNDELLGQIRKLANDENHPQQLAVETNQGINRAAIGLVELIAPSYKVGLLSNGNRQHIDKALSLAASGLKLRFDAVLASSDTGNIKPDKEAYWAMTNALSVAPEETLMIDDSPQHIAGAKAAGLQTLRFIDMPRLRRDLSELGVI